MRAHIEFLNNTQIHFMLQGG